MADPRYKNGIHKSTLPSLPTRKERIEAKLQSPAVWGWQLTDEQVDGYPLWTKGDMLMIKSDGSGELEAGWIVQVGETALIYSLDVHIGSITTDIETGINQKGT